MYENKTRKRTLAALMCLCILAALVLSGCGGNVGDGSASQTDSAGGARFKTLSDFSGAHFGAVTGSTAKLLMKGIIEDPDDFSYYNSIPDAVEALKIGKLDAVVTDEPVARLSVSKNSGIKVFEQPVVADNYGYAFRKGSNLTDKFSEVIRRFKADGTLDALKKKWTGSDDSAKTLPEQTWAGSNGVIRYYHDYTLEPMAYAVGDGSTLGLEIDLMLMIAKELDYKVEMTSCEFGALIASLESGKADVVSGSMSITEERKKKVDFAETHYEGALVLIMQDADAATAGAGFWQYISEGFKSTFVTEGRWKLIVSGLGVTVLISVLSGVFGLILGFGICMLRRLRNKPSKLVSAVFVRLVQGTPVVVLLMILYYIIFGSADISGIVVSIVGFSINFGAYSSEIMRSGIEVVDKGQREAALAMGFNRFKTFRRIIFPQAARNFLPVLRGEFISMVKTTSVVGYIAVQDMTKVSDIIRSNSMEAFFPLIVTAMLYFAIANLMTGGLSYLEHRLQPKHGKKTLKGVVIK